MEQPTYEEAMLKWVLISHHMEVDRGCDNCALCNYYDDSSNEYEKDSSIYYDCLHDDDVCPINQQTNDNKCDNTPYFEYYTHAMEKHKWMPHFFNLTLSDLPECIECKRLALSEALFIDMCIKKHGGVRKWNK